MKKILALIFTLIIFSFSINAQNGKNFTEWITVYSDDAYPNSHKVEIAFSLGKPCTNYSFYKTRSDFQIEGGTLVFYFDFLDCDGKSQKQSVSVFLDKAKIDNYIGNWFIGSKVETPYRDVVFHDPTSNMGSAPKDNPIAIEANKEYSTQQQEKVKQKEQVQSQLKTENVRIEQLKLANIQKENQKKVSQKTNDFFNQTNDLLAANQEKQAKTTADREEQEKQEADAREERNRKLEEQKAELEAEEKRMHASGERLLEKDNRLDAAVGGIYYSKYPFKKPRDVENQNAKIKTVYYVAFCRIDNTITIMSPLSINKYSDDTWQSEADVSKKILSLFKITTKYFEELDETSERLTKLGYFIIPDDAYSAFETIKKNATNSGYAIKIVTETNNKTSKDFWNN